MGADIPSLETSFLGVAFDNPIILPSGIIQEIPDHLRAIDQGAGGITLKSLTVEPREGNPLPRVTKYDHGYLNSVGLRNPGIEKGVKIVESFLSECTVPVLVSIFAVSIEDFKTLAKAIDPLKPDFIELNLSCPNTKSEMGDPLGMGEESTKEAVQAVRTVVSRDTKIVAKLSPNVSDIGAVAKAAEGAGADAISAINTVGPGMTINIDTKKPVLGNREGGVSGSGILPVALRCVHDIYKAVDIPIIGIGGISTWQDAIQMMLAGATLIGVGSATYSNKNAYHDINKGLLGYMKKENIYNLSEIVGALQS